MYKRQNSSKLAPILTLCYRPETHPFNLCTVPLRDYHETVTSDILHDGNKVCLLNIHKITACLYIFLNSTEVRTEALQIFCVMIPLPDFALFRVVRPYYTI